MGAEEVLVLLGGISWRIAAVVSLAAVVAWLLRGATARSRKRVWICATGSAWVIPIAMWSLPSLRIEVGGEAGSRPASRTSVERAYDGAEAGAPGPGGSPVEPETRLSPTFDGSIAQPMTAPVDTLGGAPSRWRGRAAGVLVAMWVLGAIGFLVRLLRRVRASQRLAGATPPESRALLIADAGAIRTELGIRREVSLRRGGGITAPITLGFRRAKVLLPESAGSWCPERRRVVLTHELIHVRDRDWLGHVIAEIACAIHWFNPTVRLAARCLERERECACDEEVVRFGARPSDYARHLLEVAREARDACAAASAVAMVRSPVLEKRVMNIMTERNHGNRGAAVAVLLPAAVLVAAVVTATAQFVRAEASPAPPPPAALGTSEDLRAASPRLAQRLRDLAGLNATMADLGDAANTRQVRADELAVELDVLQSRARPLQARLVLHERQLDAANSRVHTYEAELQVLQERLALTSREADIVAERLNLLHEEAASDPKSQSLPLEIASAERELEIQQMKVEPLEMRIQATHTRLHAAGEEMRLLLEQLEPARERVMRNDEQMDPLRDGIDELRGDMDQYQRNVDRITQQVEEARRSVASELHRGLRGRLREAMDELPLGSVDRGELHYSLSRRLAEELPWSWSIDGDVLLAETDRAILATAMREAIAEEHTRAGTTPDRAGLDRVIERLAARLARQAYRLGDR